MCRMGNSVSFYPDDLQVLQNSRHFTSRSPQDSHAMPVPTCQKEATVMPQQTEDYLDLTIPSSSPTNRVRDDDMSTTSTTVPSTTPSYLPLLNPPRSMSTKMKRNTLTFPKPYRNRAIRGANRPFGNADKYASEPMIKRIKHESSSTYILDRIQPQISDGTLDNHSEYK